jgi:hypothetical protein
MNKNRNSDFLRIHQFLAFKFVFKKELNNSHSEKVSCYNELKPKKPEIYSQSEKKPEIGSV